MTDYMNLYFTLTMGFRSEIKNCFAPAKKKKVNWKTVEWSRWYVLSEEYKKRTEKFALFGIYFLERTMIYCSIVERSQYDVQFLVKDDVDTSLLSELHKSFCILGRSIDQTYNLCFDNLFIKILLVYVPVFLELIYS